MPVEIGLVDPVAGGRPPHSGAIVAHGGYSVVLAGRAASAGSMLAIEISEIAAVANVDIIRWLSLLTAGSLALLPFVEEDTSHRTLCIVGFIRNEEPGWFDPPRKPT